MEQIVKDFLDYVSYDTQSQDESDEFPSTAKQKVLAEHLAEQLRGMGLNGRMDDYGYVYAELPANCEGAPAVGFIAHMDTATELSGANVKPRIVHYEGGDIVLNEEKNIVMRAAEFESLAQQVGKDLIVTDGTTLLGADDKAGIAEILTAAGELMAEGKPHATLRIGFTPDEEIGRGADRFDLERFGADFAFTVDGGTLGELEYENFNAASAVVTVHGRNVHPGDAKNTMINSQNIAMEFHGMLPVQERPEHTEHYEGFSHLCEMHGEVELTTLEYIIRDHDRAKFEQKKALFTDIAAFLNRKYGAGTVEVRLRDSYYNMREKIEPCMYVVDAMKQAMLDEGITPNVVPIRGGTDGARLSYEGLPCPNLFTGGENYHGRFEYIPVEDMESAVRILKRLLTNAAK